MKIAILGLGMVAMADALALARHHRVTVTGPRPERIEAIRAGDYGLRDPALAGWLAAGPLALEATLDTEAALNGAGLVLVAMPLPIDPETGRPDTVEIESRIELALARCPGVPVAIRSAVPAGFTRRMQQRHPGARLLVVPEFLREGTPLGDRLAQDTLLVGDRGALGARVGALLAGRGDGGQARIRQMGPTEAEAVRHLSQAVIAARVAYFNELDSYALQHGLNARQIIEGVCLDPRIGPRAANPCLGYTSRSLPHSRAGLAALLDGLPVKLLTGIEASTQTRIALLAERIAAQGAARVGLVGAAGQAEGHGSEELLTRLCTGLRARGIAVQALPAQPSARQARGCDLLVAQRHSPALGTLGAPLFCRDLFPQDAAA